MVWYNYYKYKITFYIFRPSNMANKQKKTPAFPKNYGLKIAGEYLPK